MTAGLIAVIVVGTIAAWLKYTGRIQITLPKAPKVPEIGGKDADYVYRLKERIFTRAEENCFLVLDEVFSKKFYVVPKMEIASILDWEVKGQNWQSARAALGDKKVDFMLIHKKNMVPICAVEMGDRMLKDEDTEVEIVETEKILAEVGFPLVRIKKPEELSKREIVEKFAEVLKKYYEDDSEEEDDDE